MATSHAPHTPHAASARPPQAPNFGFALAVRRFDALKAKGQSLKPPLQLGSVRHMINAAEPVDAGDLAAFHACFEPFGLPPNVVFPTYGLAEHTVFVCSGGSQVTLPA